MTAGPIGVSGSEVSCPVLFGVTNQGHVGCGIIIPS